MVSAPVRGQRNRLRPEDLTADQAMAAKRVEPDLVLGPAHDGGKAITKETETGRIQVTFDDRALDRQAEVPQRVEDPVAALGVCDVVSHDILHGVRIPGAGAVGNWSEKKDGGLVVSGGCDWEF